MSAFFRGLPGTGKWTGAPLLAAAIAALSGCAETKPLYVDQAWIQLNANPDAPAAGYFVAHGGPEDVVLRRVSTEAAQRLEMHESITGPDRVTRMKPVDSVPIPAKTDVAFAPGGKHLMLWAINPDIATTGKLEMTFVFSNGDRLLVDAVIRKPGASSVPAAANAADHGIHLTGRALTPGERGLAASLFGDAIEYDLVRLHRRKWWPFQPSKVTMAPDGGIWFHPAGGHYCDDFCNSALSQQGLFVHEMTHVWQAQRSGRWWLPLMRHPFCRYDYEVRPGRPFHRYGIEQQAEIVRHSWLLRAGISLPDKPPLSVYEALLPFPAARTQDP